MKITLRWLKNRNACSEGVDDGGECGVGGDGGR